MLVIMAHDICEAEPEEEEQKPWCPDAELPLEGDAMTAHLLDAHEEAGQPGTVYLFCKVRGAPLSTPACSAWQPCTCSARCRGHCSAHLLDCSSPASLQLAWCPGGPAMGAADAGPPLASLPRL